jgi:glyceraldehyde-3-phosphate dehydrogenase (NADP+)
MPEPCGIVVAITPFNYPALLVCHKIGPALAAGNAVILKPAVTTPMTALLLTECFVSAGFPENALQCITGRGSVVGPALCTSSLVRKISFTGSVEVGHSIARTAGAKRLTCELGSTAAIVVLPDADVELASREIVRSAYSNAGQVCISAQRVLVDPLVSDELVERVTHGTDQLVAGDPSDARTTMGPVISQSEADRIVSVIDSAKQGGGVIVRGGEASGSVVAPTIVVGPAQDSSLWRDELFGPAVAIRKSPNLEDAIRTANDSPFGLSMSIFTQDIDRAMTFARRIRSGMVHINSGTHYRIDAMPYGGIGESGYGKEGIRYAMDEMTEHKLVIIHPGANALDASA